MNQLLSVLVLILVISACKKEATLQSYLVESQNKKGFVSVDIPSSVLKLSQKEGTIQETKEVLETIKKATIIGMPYKGNETIYEAEKQKLKNVFLNETKYKKLASFKENNIKANLYYLGEADNIDEVVAFGYSKEVGVGVVRLLGENMNPSKIMKAMKYANIDGKEKGFSNLIKIIDNTGLGIKINIPKEETKTIE